MRALLANLEQFYRERAVWLFYAIAGFFVLLSGSAVCLLAESPSQARQDVPVLFALAIFAVGAVVGGYQGVLLEPPFAACLPGHRITIRRVIFLIGLSVSLVASLSLLPGLGQPLLPLSRSGLPLESAFCLYLTAFLAGAGLAFIALHGNRIFVRWLAFFVLVAAWPAIPLAHRWLAGIEGLATGQPLFTNILGTATVFVTWFLFGRPARLPHPGTGPDARRGCRPHEISASALSRFLLGRMRASAYASIAKHVWGALYAWQLRGGGARWELTWLVAFSLASCVVAWYNPLSGGLYIAIASVGLLIRTHPLPATLPVGGGRRERFVATMALLILLGGILMLTVALTFVTMDLLEPYIPQGFIRAEDLQSRHLQPITLRLATLLTSLFPIGCFLEVLWGERRVLMFLARSMLFVVAGELAAFKGAWVMAVSPAYTAAGVVLAWSISAYGIYRVTMTSDLVRR
jgi:hypothetical protein